MRNLTFARALAALDRTRSGAQAGERLRSLILRADACTTHRAPQPDDRQQRDTREPALWILHAR